LERFTIDYINSIQNKNPNSFKEKYRKYDVIIMDDIQFISNREKTQEELFHMFNTLYENNKQIIFSSDKDLTQLISPNVSIYSPIHKSIYKFGDKIKFKDIEVPHQNVLVCKVFMGDKSDNIDGIQSLGEKTFVKLFPLVQEKSCTIEEIMDIAGNIPQEKPIKVLSNILIGKTKSGILGEQYYQINQMIVDLSKPLITDEGKELVETIYRETLDPTDRGYKNLMKYMMEDGLFKYLPKNDEAWVNFLKPFMKLTRKEKRKIKN
jgi:5'-3' exonuclease